MRRTYICGSPYHVGDRLIASRRGAFERRIEFRRLGDQGREAEVLDRIVCHACLTVEVAERRDEVGAKTTPMFGEGSGE